MSDVLSALIPPAVVGAVVIYAIVRLFRSEERGGRRPEEPAQKSRDSSSSD